jgi:hypothetical protein
MADMLVLVAPLHRELRQTNHLRIERVNVVAIEDDEQPCCDSWTSSILHTHTHSLVLSGVAGLVRRRSCDRLDQAQRVP